MNERNRKEFSDEYDETVCRISGTICDKKCPHFNYCPIEEFDRTVGDAVDKFIDETIKILKEKNK